MIEISGHRQDAGFPEKYPMPTREVSVGKAVAFLVEVDLSWGGKVTEVTSEPGGQVKIETRTSVMGKVDTTWYRGSEEEVRPLLQVAACHAQVRSHPNFKALHASFEKIGGSYPFPVEARQMLLGGTSAKATMLLAMGARDETLVRLQSFEVSDLCAAWELASYRTDGMFDILRG